MRYYGGEWNLREIILGIVNAKGDDTGESRLVTVETIQLLMRLRRRIRRGWTRRIYGESLGEIVEYSGDFAGESGH